jgi:parvulin-like peptidyl-prolyl isomerase
MLKALRERTKVILWIVIVGFVGFIFAVWGAGLTSSRKRSSDVVVGTVDGQRIEYDSFNRAYRRSLAAARRSAPEAYSDEQLTRRVLDDTWNDFLSGVLLRREVKREGIKVFDKELLEHILRNPPEMLREHEALQTNGVFDQAKYLAALRTPGQDWRWLEGYYANALPLLKLQRRVEAAAYVSTWERERQSSLENRRVTVAYLYADSRRWERLTPSEAKALTAEMRDLRSRALGGEDFASLARSESDAGDAASGGDMGWVDSTDLAPDLRDAVFSLGQGEISEVLLSGDAYHLFKVEEVAGESRRLTHIVKQLLRTVDPADVQRYYAAHPEEFSRPPLARVAFVSLAKTASAADSAEIEAEFREVAEQAAAGEDFGELATIYSDAPSASRSGDLGLVTMGTLRPDFEDALSGLEPGEVSQPFLTSDGWQLLELEEKKRENGETKLRLRQIQMRIEPSDETLARLLDRMDEVAADASESGLLAAAAATGLEVRESGTFPRSPVIPGLGELPRGAYWAHEAKKGDVSPVLETDDAYYVLTLLEKIPGGTSPLAEVRGRIEATLRMEEARRLAKEHAESVRSELVAGATMEALARTDTLLTLSQAGPFGPGDYVPEVGSTGEFHGAAFALEEGQYGPVVETRRGFFILRLLSVEQGEAPPESGEATERILAAARARLQQEWFAMLVDRADIEDDRDRFYVL